jgi:hypothetical protein
MKIIKLFMFFYVDNYIVCLTYRSPDPDPHQKISGPMNTGLCILSELRECSRLSFNLFIHSILLVSPIFFLKLKKKGPYSSPKCPPSKYSMHRIHSIQ